MMKVLIFFLLLCSINALIKPHNKATFPKITLLDSSSAESAESSSLQPKKFLKTVLSIKSKPEVKAELLQQVQKLRMQENTNEWSIFMDSLLTEIDGVSTNKWATRRWPIPLPSYRVKLGIMRRMVDTLMKEEQRVGIANDQTNNNIRRRRALAVLLSQLRSVRGAFNLEKEASRPALTMEDMFKRTPEGLETPKYDVIAKRSSWEVRAYKSFSVCSIDMGTQRTSDSGDKDNSYTSGSFNALAGYLFGRNQQSQKMAMTTPVISTRSSAEDQQTKMSFVLPSEFWESTEGAPTPMEDSPVLVESGAMDEALAVMWFGGYANKAEADRKAAELVALLKEDSEWMVKEELAPGRDPYFLMQYNDPFQPPWKRRNEVAVRVVPRVKTPGDPPLVSSSPDSKLQRA